MNGSGQYYGSGSSGAGAAAGDGGGPLSPTRSSPARALSPGAGGARAPGTSTPFKTSQLSQSLDEALGDMPEGSSNPGASRQPVAPPPVASTSRLQPAVQEANGQDGRAGTPARQPTTAGKSAPRNPLIDLIDTEHGYVDDLAMVIKVSLHRLSIAHFP